MSDLLASNRELTKQDFEVHLLRAYEIFSDPTHPSWYRLTQFRNALVNCGQRETVRIFDETVMDVICRFPSGCREYDIERQLRVAISKLGPLVHMVCCSDVAYTTRNERTSS